MTDSRRKTINRIAIYTAGMIILAAGITLHTKAQLGISPLISMPFAVSEITGWNFASLAFVMYALFTAISIALSGQRRRKIDWLMFPYSLLFSVLLQVFGDLYDNVTAAMGLSIDGIIARFILLLIAVSLTGIGVSMSVTMRYIPNPADALAREVGIKINRGLGLGKNVIDITAVAITCAIGLIMAGHIVSIGIGTIVGMIGVGRACAAFNYFMLDKMKRAAGLENEL